MDEKELEALKASNPKAYEHIVSLKAANDKTAADKAAKDAADKAAADKAAKDKAGSEGDDLREKIRKEKEAQDNKAGEMKGIEKALKFNLGVADFVKGNVDALPAEIGEILTAAGKEKYDSAVEQASAVKAAFIQSFFAIQTNLEMLTANQKAQLEDYLKLTKNGKEQKAEAIYENIFEPALETLKKVKKAEELGKANAGFASSSKVDDKYKERLMAHSRKAHLNEKGDK